MAARCRKNAFERCADPKSVKIWRFEPTT
jgi:hypothetical protein